MTNITLKDLEPKLLKQLQQRANQNGRALEAEISAILTSVLTQTKPEYNEPNLASAIKQRFADIGGVEFSDIQRDPIRTPPTF